MSFAEFVEQVYWEEAQHLRTSSRQTYDSWIRRHVNPRLGGIPVGEISDWHMRLFVLDLRQQLTGTTVANILTLVRSILDSACAHGLLARNPARSLPRALRAGGARKPLRFLNEQEIKALLAAVPAEGWERTLFCVCLFAGLRSGEVRGLCWSDIDPTAGVLRVRQQIVGNSRQVGPLKTANAERDAPLNSTLRSELLAYREQWEPNRHDLLFSLKGEPLRAATVWYRMQQAVKHSGIHNATLHDLRRTFGAVLVAADCDVTYVQTCLGHANPAVTLRIYSAL